MEVKMSNNLKLWKLQESYSRMGTIFQLFARTQKDVEKLVGTDYYFSDILGKHSEIYGEFKMDDVKCISEDQELIDKMSAEGILPAGNIGFIQHLEYEYNREPLERSK
jgi:hypothetical protein